MSVLYSKVLVLNRSYLPVHVTVVRRALSLLYQGVARAVDEQYRTFDFDSWADLAADEDAIGLVNRAIRVPRVILLQGYDRVPRRYVRFSRFNIYSRDQNRCQYCGRQFPRAELNLDHVVPRSRGWDVDLGERRLLLSSMQSAEGRAHADRGRHATRPAAAAPAVDAVHGGDVQSPTVQGVDALPERGGRGVLEHGAGGGVALGALRPG